MLHTADLWKCLWDVRANVEYEQSDPKAKPDAQTNQQGDNTTNEAIHVTLVGHSSQDQYPEETYEYLQWPVHEPKHGFHRIWGHIPGRYQFISMFEVPHFDLSLSLCYAYKLGIL